MKKHITSVIIIIATLFLSCLNANAQDTVPKEEDNPGGWDFTTPFVRVSPENGKAKYCIELSSSFSFGFISGVNQADGVSIDMGQSYEMHWDNVLNARARLGRRGMFALGLGFDWRNYRMTNGNRFVEDETGHITISDDTPVEFSRIHTFSLSVPLKYYHQLGKHVYLGVGPELYFTPHASLKDRYDGKHKMLDTHIHHNRFSLDVGAEINVHGVGLYYKYNPFNVLDTNFGPKFGSMTVGVKVDLFTIK